MKERLNRDINTSVTVYSNSYELLSDELKKLDILIRRRKTAFRMEMQSRHESEISQNLYISHEEVDWLLNDNKAADFNHPELLRVSEELELLQRDINKKVAATLETGLLLTPVKLAQIFNLSLFEMQVLIICIAPELNHKYDKLFAYLQDDITRKKPSIDLALQLLCKDESERWTARGFFTENSPLFRNGILQVIHDPQSPSGSSDLAMFLKIESRFLNFLLGNNAVDARLSRLVRFYQPKTSMETVLVGEEIKKKLLILTKHHFSEKNQETRSLILYLSGSYGVGKRELALGIAGTLHCSLMVVDVELLLTHGLEFEKLCSLIFREGLLQQAAIYFHNMDVLQKEEKANSLMKKLGNTIDDYGWLTFLDAENPYAGKPFFNYSELHSVELPVSDVALREKAWKRVLEELQLAQHGRWAELLARQFLLTKGQINDVAQCITNNRKASEQKEIKLEDLYAASRLQSNQKLSELSRKIVPHYNWKDIILSKENKEQLKEICSQVKNHYRVFTEWGFDRKFSYGKGLSVLFTGPPGTGKTMAAEVIAKELSHDMYKIDLSGVVSKYIGETEKNLSKIFKEAETSNAILFFDEADALFGKRTQVSDAHDRYANIETSYLLQRMEEYEGMVILATNLQENMDEAFSRRIRFIVDFPFPDAENRLQIWKTHIPREAPVNDNINFELLSRQFQIAGGNIKNIVLNAAFLAVENGGMIGMEHIMQGTKREYGKIGKLWDEQNVMHLIDCAKGDCDVCKERSKKTN